MAPTTATSQIQQRTIETLARTMHDFDIYGVSINTNPWTGWGCWKGAPLLFSPTFNTHWRFVAKELKRPLVLARGGWGGAHGDRYHMYLVLPRRRYLDPVLAWLRLAAQDDHDAPVREVGGAKTVAEYSFYGARGERAFQSFLTLCRTNPDVRRALKLPELPTEVTTTATEARYDDRRAA